MSDAIDMDHLGAWIGRTDAVTDTILPFPARGMAATLDHARLDYGDGDALPPLWHWLYFLPVFPMREAGYDGHAALGGFLPPVPLPRRMWAGGRLTFHNPLWIGEAYEKRSTIKDVSHKRGRSGEMVFVTVRHEYHGDGLHLSEEHDIVYRAAPDPGAVTPDPAQAPGTCDFQHETVPSPILLFRYSALTFNGHRIHYDRPFCAKEGYDGLVVHGPLMATCLLDLVGRARPDATLAAFDFRALAPVTDGAPFRAQGADREGGADLWIRRYDGALAMQGSARYV